MQSKTNTTTYKRRTLFIEITVIILIRLKSSWIYVMFFPTKEDTDKKPELFISCINTSDLSNPTIPILF